MRRVAQVLVVFTLAVGLLWLVWLAMAETEWEERTLYPPYWQPPKSPPQNE